MQIYVTFLMNLSDFKHAFVKRKLIIKYVSKKAVVKYDNSNFARNKISLVLTKMFTTSIIVGRSLNP